MIVKNHPDIHLTYCLNVHPGERWEENLAAIRQHVPEVKARVAPDTRFGLGLRIGHQAALDLQANDRLSAFRDYLRENDLYVFTINGFPYGSFHQQRVKENVYRPDWRTEERRDYTHRLADLLAALLPDGTEGSISTVPGSFKPWIQTDADVSAMVDVLMDSVARLAEIHETAGKEIHLGLEPEPGCYIETTDETIEFFRAHLLTRGVDRLAEKIRCGKDRAEELVRRHLGVCFDACHLAIQYEDLAASLRRYRAEGIRISKIHLSAALRSTGEPSALEALSAFDEPVYLHQVVARDAAGTISFWTDLGPALTDLSEQSLPDVRVHFHVPLFWEGSDRLDSTSSDLSPAFFAELQQACCRHLEIETYTFDVLPREVRPDRIDESIGNEFAWVMKRWETGE